MNRTKIISMYIVYTLIIQGVFIALSFMHYRDITSMYNEALYQVYEMDTQEIRAFIEILQSDIEIDENLLHEYGYDIQDPYLLQSSKETFLQSLFLNVSIVQILLTILYVVKIMTDNKRQKELAHIVSYLHKLRSDSYLELQRFDEGMTSKLETEIYKNIILFKEKNDSVHKEKESIKDNVVNISHQLKTPLTAMTIMVDNIVEDPAMESSIRQEFMKDIQGNVVHMEFLLQALLTLSKFDANVIAFERQKIDTSILFAQVSHKLKPLLDEKNIQLIISGTNGSFYGDLHWELEAMLNIVKNAVEYSKQNGVIEVFVKNNNFQTFITISDYGDGIEESELQNIFTRFHRTSNSVSKGIGVGLYLSKTIIEKDCGKIKVFSKINEKTTFEIIFPNA